MSYFHRIWLLIPLALTAIVITYSIAGLDQLGLVHLHADQWRIIADYELLPFPASLLESQNGHRPVIPGLLHYINWMLLGNDQLAVLLLGYALAVLVALLLAMLAWRHSGNHSLGLLAGLLSVAVVLWVGNSGILYRSNESIHSYLVILPLILGLYLLAPDSKGEYAGSWPRSLALVLMGFTALLSFGTGLSVLPAFTLMALLLGHTRVALRVLLPALIAALLLYFVLLPDGGKSSGSSLITQLSPGAVITSLGYLLKWLSAPVSAAFIDTLPYADSYSLAVNHYLGPALALVSAVYLCHCLLQYLRKQRRPSTAEVVFAGMAVSMATAGAMVVVARAKFYVWYPDDVLNNRYFVWSTLYWLGVLALPLLRARQGVKLTTWGLVTSLVLALLVASSSDRIHGTAKLGRKQSDLVSLRFSLGIIADQGLWNIDKIHGWHFSAEEYLDVIARLKNRGVPIHALEVDQQWQQPVAIKGIEKGPKVGARLVSLDRQHPGGGQFAELRIGNPRADIQRAYIIDDKRRTVGYLMPYPTWHSPFAMSADGQPKRLYGLIRDYMPATNYSYLSLIEDGKQIRGKLNIQQGNARASAQQTMSIEEISEQHD